MIPAFDGGTGSTGVYQRNAGEQSLASKSFKSDWDTCKIDEMSL